MSDDPTVSEIQLRFIPESFTVQMASGPSKPSDSRTLVSFNLSHKGESYGAQVWFHEPMPPIRGSRSAAHRVSFPLPLALFQSVADALSRGRVPTIEYSGKQGEAGEGLLTWMSG